jgi:hypothetical protein
MLKFVFEVHLRWIWKGGLLLLNRLIARTIAAFCASAFRISIK